LRPGVNPAYRGPAIVAVAGVVISRSPTKKVANSGSGSYRVAMQTWLSERVVFDPAVCHGKPVVRGTRVLVANVVGAVAAGEAGTEILRDYPSLTEADIQACLEFAGRLTAMEGIEAELAPR
jgi:uncharacterized protein (DUF433 family)